MALSDEEIEYLNGASNKLRPNRFWSFWLFKHSEYCRHKIFNGTFVIDGEEKPSSLLNSLRRLPKESKWYRICIQRQCWFLKGPVVEQLAPKRGDIPDYYSTSNFESAISLKSGDSQFSNNVLNLMELLQVLVEKLETVLQAERVNSSWALQFTWLRTLDLKKIDLGNKKWMKELLAQTLWIF